MGDKMVAALLPKYALEPRLLAYTALSPAETPLRGLRVPGGAPCCLGGSWVGRKDVEEETCNRRGLRSELGEGSAPLRCRPAAERLRPRLHGPIVRKSARLSERGRGGGGGTGREAWACRC